METGLSRRGPFARLLVFEWTFPYTLAIPSKSLSPAAQQKSPRMVSKRQKRLVDEDPLTRAIAPPPNETPVERELRIAAELEAKRVSDAIDEELNRQRIADKKYPKPVKILLLGAYTLSISLGATAVPPPSGRSE